jgi:hypothetical protein
MQSVMYLSKYTLLHTECSFVVMLEPHAILYEDRVTA